MTDFYTEGRHGASSTLSPHRGRVACDSNPSKNKPPARTVSREPAYSRSKQSSRSPGFSPEGRPQSDFPTAAWRKPQRTPPANAPAESPTTSQPAKGWTDRLAVSKPPAEYRLDTSALSVSTLSVSRPL